MRADRTVFRKSTGMTADAGAELNAQQAGVVLQKSVGEGQGRIVAVAGGDARGGEVLADAGDAGEADGPPVDAHP